MNHLIRYITAAVLLLAVSKIWSQGRIMPVIETTASPLSLSTGGTRLGSQSSAYIYTHPASAIGISTLAADYALSVTTSEGPNLTLHAPTVAVAAGRGVVLVGFRYLAMGQLSTVYDEQGQLQPGQTITMKSYTVDGGYALPLGSHLSAFATIGYAAQRTGTKINAVYGSLGASYADSTHIGSHCLRYDVAATFSQLGGYSYSGSSGSLSPRLALGGSARLSTLRGQYLHIYIEGAQYFKAGRAKSSNELSGGIGYTLCEHYSLFVGGHAGDHDPAVSTGLSVRLRPVTVSLSARFGTQSDSNNIYMAGVSLRL